MHCSCVLPWRTTPCTRTQCKRVPYTRAAWHTYTMYACTIHVLTKYTNTKRRCSDTPSPHPPRSLARTPSSPLRGLLLNQCTVCLEEVFGDPAHHSGNFQRSLCPKGAASKQAGFSIAPVRMAGISPPSFTGTMLSGRAHGGANINPCCTFYVGEQGTAASLADGYARANNVARTWQGRDNDLIMT